jgi:hypothetical protein
MESFLQNRPSVAIAGGVTPHSDRDGDFHPFFRPSLSQDDPCAQALTGQNTPGDQAENEPKIELVDREGCIERIVVTCACCRQIELKCEY